MSVDPQMLQAYMAMAQRPQQTPNTGTAGGITQLLSALMMAKRLKAMQQQQPNQVPNTQPPTPPMTTPPVGFEGMGASSAAPLGYQSS